MSPCRWLSVHPAHAQGTKTSGRLRGGLISGYDVDGGPEHPAGGLSSLDATKFKLILGADSPRPIHDGRRTWEVW